MRSQLEEVSGKEFLSFLRCSGRERLLWKDRDLGHFQDFVNSESCSSKGKRRKNKSESPKRTKKGESIWKVKERWCQDSFLALGRSRGSGEEDTKSEVAEAHISTPMSTASLGALSVGALRDEAPRHPEEFQIADFNSSHGPMSGRSSNDGP